MNQKATMMMKRHSLNANAMKYTLVLCLGMLTLSSCDQNQRPSGLFETQSNDVLAPLANNSAAGASARSAAISSQSQNTTNSSQGQGNASIPYYQQDFHHCNQFSIQNRTVDPSNPEYLRCQMVIYQNCKGCRVDENLQPLNTFEAYGYSGRVGWPAHEDWWPRLQPLLSPDRSHIAYRSPYFNSQNFPGQGGAYGQGQSGYPQGQNHFVYCQDQGPECRLNASKVWAASAIDKSYEYNLSPESQPNYVYSIVANSPVLNQPCPGQQNTRANDPCNTPFRNNFGNILGGFKGSGKNILTGLKGSGKNLVKGLGASLLASVPRFSVGSLLPSVSSVGSIVPQFSMGQPGSLSIGSGGRYTTSSAGNIAIGGGGQYTTTPGGHVAVGGNGQYTTSPGANMAVGNQYGYYAGQPMAAYGHYLNYTANSQNNYNLGTTQTPSYCQDQRNTYHPGYALACQTITPCQVYGGC